MKDSKGYIERMKASMKEKLFFVDKIDLNNKIIVDFGCAEGDLLQELDHMGLENTTLIGVENNAEFCSHINGEQKITGKNRVCQGVGQVQLPLLVPSACQRG